VDYSIHFFIRRKNGMEGSAVRRSLFRGVSLSFVSSFICFLIFLFAPFGILRQFALFSAAGLLSSYVTVLCLYPCILPAIYIKTANQDLGSNPNQKRDLSQNARKALLAGLGIIFLVLILVSQVTPEGKNRLRIKNDIRNLYSVSPDLFESEQIASSILGYNSGEWFLVSGDTLQELLEHEEILLDQ
jgi:predicted exporter